MSRDVEHTPDRPRQSVPQFDADAAQVFRHQPAVVFRCDAAIRFREYHLDQPHRRLKVRPLAVHLDQAIALAARERPIQRVFRRYLPWFAQDFVTAFAAVALAGLLWRANMVLDVGLWPSVFAALALAFVFSAVNLLLGVQRTAWDYAGLQDALEVVLSSVLATAVTRTHWLFGSLLVTLVGATSVVASGGLGVGISYAVSTGRASEVWLVTETGTDRWSVTARYPLAADGAGS